MQSIDRTPPILDMVGLCTLQIGWNSHKNFGQAISGSQGLLALRQEELSLNLQGST